LAVNAAHSEFYGGMIGGYALSCYFTNCLMDRMGGGQFEGYPGNAFIVCRCQSSLMTLFPGRKGCVWSNDTFAQCGVGTMDLLFGGDKGGSLHWL